MSTDGALRDIEHELAAELFALRRQKAKTSALQPPFDKLLLLEKSDGPLTLFEPGQDAQRIREAKYAFQDINRTKAPGIVKALKNLSRGPSALLSAVGAVAVSGRPVSCPPSSFSSVEVPKKVCSESSQQRGIEVMGSQHQVVCVYKRLLAPGKHTS